MIATLLATLLLTPEPNGLLSTAADPKSLEHYEGDRFAVTVNQIAEGIYVFGRQPSWRYSVQPNTLVIVNAADVVVVDGGYGSYSENIVKGIRRITDKPVSVVINTHWHQDHNLGHYVFKREWPQVRVIAHHETRARMIEDDDFLGRKTPVDLNKVIMQQQAQLAEARREGRSPAFLAYLSDLIKGLPLAHEEFAQASLVPADETFSHRLVLYRDDRRIELLHFGAANTKGDVVVWLPVERIVAAGDLVVRPTPYGFGSSPASWGNVLRSINGLDYRILVPGHGDLQYDPAYVRQLTEMMDMISAQACMAVAAGAEDGSAITAAVNWSAFETAFTKDDPLLTHLFEKWFKNPIGRGAMEEILKEPSVCL